MHPSKSIGTLLQFIIIHSSFILACTKLAAASEKLTMIKEKIPHDFDVFTVETNIAIHSLQSAGKLIN